MKWNENKQSQCVYAELQDNYLEIPRIMFLKVIKTKTVFDSIPRMI